MVNSRGPGWVNKAATTPASHLFVLVSCVKLLWGFSQFNRLPLRLIRGRGEVGKEGGSSSAEAIKRGVSGKDAHAMLCVPRQSKRARANKTKQNKQTDTQRV